MQQLPPPVRVVEALLQYEPDSTLIQDSVHGRVPLAYACANGASDEIIFQLLHTTPRGKDAASILDHDGRNALHHACAAHSGATTMYTSAETIRLLLEIDPTLAILPDHFGRTPLNLFWESHRDVLCRSVDDFREYAELDEESLNFLDLELSELFCTGLPNLY